MAQSHLLLAPFAGLRPTPAKAADVIAPPYDVLNTEEARRRADGRPWSFLHISKPEIDLAVGTDPYDDTVYAKGAENLTRMMAEGILKQDEKRCYYVYRAVMGDHTQTGIVGAGSIPAYQRNRIRRHEFTRPDKETDRVRQIDALNAQTGPVMVTHRANMTLSSLTEAVCDRAPEYAVTLDDGVQHTLWVIDDPTEITLVTETFEAMDAIYIADGHHRSAAATRVAEQRRDTGEPCGDERFLIVSFPDDQVQILDYNRAVRDLNGRTREAFLMEVDSAFVATPSDTPFKPKTAATFGMYLENAWYSLTPRDTAPIRDPVAALDISILSDRLLAPILGVGDPRVDKRIDFIGGIRGLDELERRVNSGEMAVAFALYPTSLSDLMSVADADAVMPPKSTWFEPKLADGMVSLILD